MDIYIRSRGVSQGYRWLKTSEGKSSQEDPPIPPQFMELIDSDASSLSLVLGRSSGKLILYVTGFRSRQRKDERNREIKNSVTWVSSNSKDEEVIQTLVVQALRGELATIVDNTVQSSGNNGFETIPSELLKLLPQGSKGELAPQVQQKLGNLDLRINALATEISQLKKFPRKEGLLIVVTGICERNTLEKLGIWRGLSTEINPGEETWEVSQITRSQTKFYESTSSVVDRIGEFVRTSFTQKVLALVLIASLLLNALLGQQLAFSKSLEKQNENLKFENQELLEINQKLREVKQLLETKQQALNNENQLLTSQVDNLKKKLQKAQQILDD